jgi:phosphohistidine phosphatase
VILHFLRHAKTNQLSPNGRDYDRELLPRGYEQLSEFRAFVVQRKLSIDHIYCSAAKRTRQTLDEIADLFPNATISFHEELYLASWSELLTFLSAKNSPQISLLIGHNEGLSDLASYLTGSDIHLKTCGYVQLSFPFDHSGFISANTGNVVETFRSVRP